MGHPSPSPLRRRALRALPAAGASLALLLAGCASTPSGSDDAADGAAESFEGVELTVWSGLYYEPFASVNAEQIQACADDLGLTVNLETLSEDYATKILQAASSNTLPDVLLLDSTDVPRFGAEGILTDIGDVGLTTEGISDSVASLGQYEGVQYGLPTQVETYALFYDRAAFADAGVEEFPTTFDELVSVASRLSEDGRYGIALPGATSDGAAPLFWLPFLLSAGGDPADPTSEGAVAAVDLYQQLVETGGLSSEFVSWGWDAPDQYRSGKAVITASGPWDVVAEAPEIADYGVAPYPTLDGSQESSVGILGYNWSLPVSADAEQQQAAAALIECRVSEENQLELADGGYIPALTSAQEAFVEATPAAAAFVDPIENAYNYAGELGAEWDRLSLVYGSALQYAVVDGESAEDALARADAAH
ncbi:extracellular solute-binding protein [Microbacterium betulae]|uniref:Extracellular solute-binding protein n=1 Tax=Microbacterium betulae TaxID=2981139 RepID=A0AA97I6M7_9MICO|nr:extracellular solute-binding protein [Microbacterium sp. AB]WOF22787.1 extracellular solute-binding protein [Microbacterium sp. AB]